LPEGKVIIDKIDINKIVNEISKYSEKGAGALTIFIGFVKGEVDGKKVSELDYSVYEPYTTEKLNEIAISELDNDVYDIRIYHRTGNLSVGEPTVYIFVAAKSREKAFKKAREVLERVKHEPYIFKLEKREDGEYWVLGDGKRLKRIENP